MVSNDWWISNDIPIIDGKKNMIDGTINNRNINH